MKTTDKRKLLKGKSYTLNVDIGAICGHHAIENGMWCGVNDIWRSNFEGRGGPKVVRVVNGKGRVVFRARRGGEHWTNGEVNRAVNRARRADSTQNARSTIEMIRVFRVFRGPTPRSSKV